MGGQRSVQCKRRLFVHCTDTPCAERVVLEMEPRTGEITVWRNGASIGTSAKVTFRQRHTFVLSRRDTTWVLELDGVERARWTQYVRHEMPGIEAKRFYVGSDRHDAYFGSLKVFALAVWRRAMHWSADHELRMACGQV